MKDTFMKAQASQYKKDRLTNREVYNIYPSSIEKIVIKKMLFPELFTTEDQIKLNKHLQCSIENMAKETEEVVITTISYNTNQLFTAEHLDLSEKEV